MKAWLTGRRQRQLRRLKTERAAHPDGERADYIYAPDIRRLERQLGRSAAVEPEPGEAAQIPGSPDPSPWPGLPIGCELPVCGLVSEGHPDQPCVSVTYDDPLGRTRGGASRPSPSSRWRRPSSRSVKRWARNSASAGDSRLPTQDRQSLVQPRAADQGARSRSAPVRQGATGDRSDNRVSDRRCAASRGQGRR
jgi:hypothetical protein